MPLLSTYELNVRLDNADGLSFSNEIIRPDHALTLTKIVKLLLISMGLIL